MPDRETVVKLAADQVALFGYGSLLMRESMERSLGRLYDGPFVDCELVGWRRTWDIAMPNRTILVDHEGERFAPQHILYLNVRRAPGVRLNGTLFVVSREELAAFDKREWIYAREPVTEQLSGVAIEDGDAYTYVGLPEHEWHGAGSPREFAVRASYVALIDAALQRRSAGFRAAYDASTDPPPAALIVNDVETTRPATSAGFNRV